MRALRRREGQEATAVGGQKPASWSTVSKPSSCQMGFSMCWFKHIYTLKKPDFRIIAVKVIWIFTRKGRVAAEQSCSIDVVRTQSKAGGILWRTTVTAGRRAGWLALGRGAYSNKREEDAEGEGEGMHLLCDGLGKE